MLCEPKGLERYTTNALGETEQGNGLIEMIEDWKFLLLINNKYHALCWGSLVVL